MFSSKAPPYALYSRLMRSRDRGDALWDPSPDVVLDERGERREDPVVQVGHVGYQQEGRWRHILDIHRPRDEQLYPELIPLEGFQVLPRQFISSHDPEGPVHFTPKSRTSFAIKTSCSSAGVSAFGPSMRFSLDSEASLIYFGRSQRDQIRKPDIGRYKEYAVRNLRHWASLVSSNGWTLDVDELSIVTDRTLAPSWVNSVQSEKTAGAQIGAQVYVNGAASGGFSVSFQSTSTTGLVTKYGPFSRLSALPPPAESESAKFYPPRHDDPAVAGPLDQCLFIKSVRAADRSLLEKGLSWLAPRVFESRRVSKDPPSLSRRDYSASTSQDGSSPGSSNGFYGGSTSTPLTEDYGSDALPEVDPDSDSYFSPDADEIYDVGKHALRYILKESGSNIAIFHDDDISPFAEELASYENVSTFFETHSLRIFSYHYDGCTIGSLSELDFGTLIAHPALYSAELVIPSQVEQDQVKPHTSADCSDAPTPRLSLPSREKKEEYDNNAWIKSLRSPQVNTERLGEDFTTGVSPSNVDQNFAEKEELGDVEMMLSHEPPPDDCSSTPSSHLSPTTDNVRGLILRPESQAGFLDHAPHGANPYNGNAGHLSGRPSANTAHGAEVPGYSQAFFLPLTSPDAIASTRYDQSETMQWSTDLRGEVTTPKDQFSTVYALTATFGDTDAEELIKHLTGQITTSGYDLSSLTSMSPAGNFREQQASMIAQTEHLYGRIIEQHLYKLARRSAYTTNVVNARLQSPLWFQCVDGRHGVPLQTLLYSPPGLSHILLDASKPVNLESTTKFIIIHVRGGAEFKRQIRTAKGTFTVANFAKQNALVVKKMLDTQDKNPRGDSALKGELILLGCVNVSRGCWQAILSERLG